MTYDEVIYIGKKGGGTGGGGGGAVTSVSNADGTITISPTTGAIIASLNLTNANTRTGQQIFNTATARFGTATASTAAVFNANKDLTSSITTLSELAFVSGVTSAIQTQLNGKQSAGNFITALTGDGTAAGPGSSALTLATVNSNVGTFSNATITVNAKGLVTAASAGTAPVTSISIASANGFAGTSSGGATPALTLSTSITGVLKGNGTAISAATAGTDYVTPIGTETLTNKNLTSGTNTFPTFNQNTTGSAATLTTTRTLWGQNFNGSANVTGSLTDVANITGGASSMIITAGTGNSRTIEFKTTTAGGVATTALTLNNLQNAIFAGEVSSTTSTTGTAFADKAVMTTIRSDNILTLTSAPLAVFDGRDKFTYGNGGLIVDTANQSVDVVHLRGIVVVPPIITEGAAAGVSPTISVTGSDLSGIIELTTGDGTTNNDVLFTLNFGAAFTTLPTVVIYPVNSNAGSLNDIYVKESTLNVAFAEIWANTLVPDRGSDYKWRYVIVEPS